MFIQSPFRMAVSWWWCAAFGWISNMIAVHNLVYLCGRRAMDGAKCGVDGWHCGKKGIIRASKHVHIIYIVFYTNVFY